MDELSWALIAAKSWAARNNAVVTKVEKKPNGNWLVTGTVQVEAVLGIAPEPDPEE